MLVILKYILHSNLLIKQRLRFFRAIFLVTTKMEEQFHELMSFIKIKSNEM